MARADEHQVPHVPRNQDHPPQNEGSHEDIAQLAVGLHKSQQLIAVQLNDSAGLARAKSHQYAASEKQVELSGELTCPADGYDFLNVARYPDGPICAAIGLHLTKSTIAGITVWGASSISQCPEPATT